MAINSQSQASFEPYKGYQFCKQAVALLLVLFLCAAPTACQVHYLQNRQEKPLFVGFGPVNPGARTEGFSTQILWPTCSLALALLIWLVMRRKAPRKEGGAVTREEAAFLRMARDALAMFMAGSGRDVRGREADEPRAGRRGTGPRKLE